MLFTLDGSQLITPGADHQVRFWRTTDGTLERSVAVPTTQPLVLFPDGRTAFIVSELYGYALFDLVRGTTTGLGWPAYAIGGFAFSPEGDRFAAAGKWCRVWSARTGDPLTTPLDHGGEVRFVDWSPDGTRLITTGLTPELKIWDASTGEQSLVPLRLGSKAMETGLWSLDGRFIVGCSDENTVRVWDAATGEPVTPILKHERDVCLARLVANNRLVTLSLPNVVRAWDLAETRLTTDVIADYAKFVAGRRLNAAGMMLPLQPDELAPLSRSLRARAAQFFE
jgi:WD40 repeat protein